MTYWYNKKDKPLKDMHGVEIKPGYLLVGVRNDYGIAWPGCIYACYTDGRYGVDQDLIEIRDTMHNNVGMCVVEEGIIIDLEIVGHFTEHLDKLPAGDLEYYFGIDLDKLRANGAEAILKKI